MKTITIYNGFKGMALLYTVKHQTMLHRPQAGAKTLPWADTLGIIASSLCLVHCVVVPLLVLALPSLSARFVHDDRTHFFLAFFVTAFCVTAIVPGYRKHRKPFVLGAMLVGLACVLTATFLSGLTVGEAGEIPLITAGNILVVWAHIANRRQLKCC